jgi:cell division septal protein FtsQ
MLQSIDKKSKITFYIFLFLLLGTLSNINESKNNKTLTKVKNIEVFGLSDSNNLKVISDLNIFLLKNIFFLGKQSIKTILVNNSLIESVRIKKIYPDTIRVKIKQTEFLAITNKSNQKFLIGSNAKEIPFETVNLGNKQLPFVFGQVDYNKFIDLKKIIDKSNFGFENIEEFYFFQSNRWDIKTKGGFLIKLPQKNLLNALQYAYLIKLDEKFKEKKIIDLRIPGKVFNSNE